MATKPEHIALKQLTPDPDKSKTEYDLSKCPPSLEDAEHHYKCTRAGKRKDILDMNEEELHTYLREVCPCCGSYPPYEELEKLPDAVTLNQLGLGYGLAAVKTKLWMWIFGLCALLSLYMVIRNILGKQCLSEEQASDPTILSTNQYLLKRLTPCKKDWVTIHSIANYGLQLDGIEVAIVLLIIVIVMLGDKLVVYQCHKHTQAFLDERHQANDWAVVVDCTDEYTAETIKANLESIGDGTDFAIQVHQVIIPADVSDYNSLCRQIRANIYRKVYLKLPETKRDPKREETVKKRLEELNKLVSEEMDYLRNPHTARNQTKQATLAIVIFKTKEMAHRVYQHWNPVQTSLPRKDSARISKDPSQVGFVSSTTIRRCGHPKELDWEKLNKVNRSTENCGRSVAMAIMLFAISVGVLVHKWLQVYLAHPKNVDRPGRVDLKSISLLATGVIFVGEQVCSICISFIIGGKIIELPSTMLRETFTTEIATHLFMGLFLFPLPFIIEYGSADIWSAAGPLADAWLMILATVGMALVFTIASPGVLIGMYCSKKKKAKVKEGKLPDVSQRELNKVVEGSSLDLLKPDQDFAVMATVALYTFSIVPVGMLIVFLGMLSYMFAYKFRVTKLSKQPDISENTFDTLPTFSTGLGVSFALGYIYIYTILIAPSISKGTVAASVFIAVAAVVVSVFNYFELFSQKYMQIQGIRNPWSKKGYSTLQYSHIRHQLDFDFESVHLLSREAAYAQLDAAILADTGLSVLQKKALRTRLGIQKNTLLMDEQKVAESVGMLDSFFWGKVGYLRELDRSKYKPNATNNDSAQGRNMKPDGGDDGWEHIPAVEDNQLAAGSRQTENRSDQRQHERRKSNLGEVVPLGVSRS